MEKKAGWGIGSRLKERRVRLNLTQAAVAKQADIKPSTLARIELGSRRATADILLRLAVPLGFTKLEVLVAAGYF
tara:strand:+ start:746 stop:970 length:225 start_codon:yes stop_codon:yes gene_type:complete